MSLFWPATGAGIVIDYTARQFHPELPFPYVAGVEEWKATVELASGQRWSLDN